MWGMFNTLQFVVHIPLFNLQMPGNLSYFFGNLITLLTFDITSLIGLSELIAEINNYDGDPIYERFGELGYGSIFIIDNMGTMFLTFIGTPALLILCLIFHLLSMKITRIFKYLYVKLSSWLQYNPILRVVLEGYLELSIAVGINLARVSFLCII